MSGEQCNATAHELVPRNLGAIERRGKEESVIAW